MLFSLFATLFCALSTKARGFDIPFQRREIGSRVVKRGGASVSGFTGLGNNADVLYTVPVELGNTVTAVNLDTGSSDLWVITDSCQTGVCTGASVARYPTSREDPTGNNISLIYGDSTTGTSASGVIGLDFASVATVAMADQAIGLINSTNNAIIQFQAAGILGLGFPAGSQIQAARVIDKFGPIQTTDNFIEATYTDGPLLARMAMTGELEAPMFSITLQRDTVDISGKGQLTIGKLPDGVSNSSITWVPARLYSPEDGGLSAPTFAPDEVYPLRWEIEVDGVFLDGQKIADSTIPPNGVIPGRVTALIDTGNSIIRGPQDMVTNILQSVSPGYDPTDTAVEPTLPCAVPHTLSFQIGGQMFPVDPRDFISPQAAGNATACIADRLVSTDPPRLGSLFSWSLGDPFMKSNLVAFYYGNLTYPSVDPPRIGFLSTVPSNASALLQQDVQDAKSNGGNFQQTVVLAPTASAAAQPQVTLTSLVQVPTLTRATTTLSGMTTRTIGRASSTPTVASQGTFNKKNAALAIARPTANGCFAVLALLIYSLLL